MNLFQLRPGLVLARSAVGARAFLLYGGIIYLVLFVYGLVVPQDSAGNFVPPNSFDNVLHLLLGIGMIALAMILTRGRAKHTFSGRSLQGRPLRSISGSGLPTVRP